MKATHCLCVFTFWTSIKILLTVKKRVVFTTHTPEKAGNEEHSLPLLNSMSFFNGVTLQQVN
jgi:starch phosphorylase